MTQNILNQAIFYTFVKTLQKYESYKSIYKRKQRAFFKRTF